MLSAYYGRHRFCVLGEYVCFCLDGSFLHRSALKQADMRCIPGGFPRSNGLYGRFQECCEEGRVLLFQQDGQDKSVCLWGLGRFRLPGKVGSGLGSGGTGLACGRNGGRTFRRQSRRNTAVAPPPQACPSGHAVRPRPRDKQILRTAASQPSEPCGPRFTAFRLPGQYMYM